MYFFRNFYTKFVIIIYCSLSSPFINAYLACMLHNLSFVYIVRIALYSFISFPTIRTSSSFYCFQFGGVLPYCVSKSALDQFTRCIAIGRCSLLQSESYIFVNIVLRILNSHRKTAAFSMKILRTQIFIFYSQSCEQFFC